jgi:23S rRNA pseudouridine2605 synthase
MRLNKWLAQNAQISRRQADELIASGKVSVNQQKARLGQSIDVQDIIFINGRAVVPTSKFTYVLVNKPTGYVCSHAGQGRPTIYRLLPKKFQHLKIAGRLDQDSSGLLLLTDDGDLILKLTHPRYGKEKNYNVTLNHPLLPADFKAVNEPVKLPDGLSRIKVEPKAAKTYTVSMKEGRNRQIRRTFDTLGYQVTDLQRTNLGSYSLSQLGGQVYKEITLE